MTRRNWILAAVVVAGVGAALLATRSSWMGGGANAQAPQQPRARTVSIEVAKAERKTVPYEVDAIGTVAPIASVAIKSRVETTIVGVKFEDGAKVAEGDMLFALDARQVDAQIAQAEGTLARDQAQLAGAERDVRRFSELIAKGATTQVNLDNAKTQIDILAGTIKAAQSALDNLRVQKSYTEIRAPFAGRISAASVKIGNFVRPADTSAMATLNQMAPVYVAFAVPQRVLAELRDGMAANTASVRATVPGNGKSEDGKIAMVENTVDPTTGMVLVRGIMDNTAETLWPGTLVNARLTVRTEEAVIVPSVAIQRSQSGNFVFVIKDGAAVVQPVEVSRTAQGQSVVTKGLNGGEDVVTDGHLQLVNGAKVEIRPRKAGA